MPKRLVQAYRQTPWRIQTQGGVLFLIVIILGVSVLWVMTSVTVQASSAGLEIQQYESEQEDLQRQIAALRTDIASQTSTAQMQKRAEAMGFKPVDPANITYIVVPGYKGRESSVQAAAPETNIQPMLVKPAYTQSLWEWLLQGVLQVSEQPGGSSP